MLKILVVDETPERASQLGEALAVAVQNATRKDEQSVATTLDALARDLQAGGIASPAILVIGEVARRAGCAALVDAGGALPAFPSQQADRQAR